MPTTAARVNPKAGGAGPQAGGAARPQAARRPAPKARVRRGSESENAAPNGQYTEGVYANRAAKAPAARKAPGRQAAGLQEDRVPGARPCADAAEEEGGAGPGAGATPEARASPGASSKTEAQAHRARPSRRRRRPRRVRRPSRRGPRRRTIRRSRRKRPGKCGWAELLWWNRKTAPPSAPSCSSTASRATRSSARRAGSPV